MWPRGAGFAGSQPKGSELKSFRVMVGARGGRGANILSAKSIEDYSNIIIHLCPSSLWTLKALTSEHF